MSVHLKKQFLKRQITAQILRVNFLNDIVKVELREFFLEMQFL